MYEEVTDNPSYLIDTMHMTQERILILWRGDVVINTLKYFEVKKLTFGRFYLLPKIHKRLCSVPRRLVISNSGLIKRIFRDF